MMLSAKVVLSLAFSYNLVILTLSSSLSCAQSVCVCSCVSSPHEGRTLHWPTKHLGLRLHRWFMLGLQTGLLPDQRQQVLHQGRVWGVLQRGQRRWDKSKQDKTEKKFLFALLYLARFARWTSQLCKIFRLSWCHRHCVKHLMHVFCFTDDLLMSNWAKRKWCQSSEHLLLGWNPNRRYTIWKSDVTDVTNPQ